MGVDKIIVLETDCVMRKYENLQYGDETLIRRSLNVLADKTTDVEAYRNAFEILGKELGKILAKKVGSVPTEEIMIVCSSEDADWLARGVEIGFGQGKLPISVYWSTRYTLYESEDDRKVEISPIVKAYEETIEKCSLLVIVKSIISSSCVVRTQLTRLIDRINPKMIEIIAPVIYKDGVPNLKRAFPKAINNKFRFLTFAVDENRKGREVIPGIGGMVYLRLGLGDINAQNRYIPKMVRSRCRL